MRRLPPPLLSYDAAGEFGVMFPGLLAEEEALTGVPIPAQVVEGDF